MPHPFIPFSNGTEAMVWQEHNCDQCANRPKCSAAKNIDLGYITGEIPWQSAAFIGNQAGKLKWRCDKWNVAYFGQTKRGPRTKPGQTLLF
jgi:hypothetical protein